MILYIKRDITDITSRFTVFDETCTAEKYLVTGTHSAAGEKMQIVPANGSEVLLTIKKIPLPVLHTYSISDKKESIKLIVNNAGKTGTCYYYGISWRIRGTIETGSYDIVDADNTVIASHIKRWSSCGDGFELNVNNEDRELFCIATAVCLNSFLAAEIPAVAVSS